MSYYKKIFNNKTKLAGASKGAQPSWLMPPHGAFNKVGYQIFEAIDLICEGPVAGLVDERGLLLDEGRVIKDYNTDNNIFGSSTNGIDKGIYFNDTALRSMGNSAQFAKYDASFKPGEEFQSAPEVVRTPRKIIKINELVKGPYGGGGHDGARTGRGSLDIRYEGTDGRDFVSWQNFVPKEQRSKPYIYYNYDKNIKKIDIALTINSLSDTKSYSTKSENESGKSRLGSLLRNGITFQVVVGKVDKDGNDLDVDYASFTCRAAKGVTVGRSNGSVNLYGVVTQPYQISLEGIQLPELTNSDLHSFARVSKVEFETYSSLVQREGGVAHVTEIIDETLTYPNSCYIESAIDSKYFPQIPSRTFRLKGKKVLIPSNYTPIDENGRDRRFSDDGSTFGNTIYDGQWDGTFKFGWTDNPAWIFYDLLVNTRYGIGSYLRDINVIDKWSLYEIGMYCDAVGMNDGESDKIGKFIGLDDGFGGLEPRFSSNLTIIDQTKAYETLQDFAKSFMAVVYYNNSSVNVRMDRPHFYNNPRRDSLTLSLTEQVSDEYTRSERLKYPAHLNFSNLNVKDGIFVYSDVDKNTKYNAIEVSYLDKRNNYKYNTEYVEDAESIKEIGLNFKQTDALGTTSRGQAKRMARALLFETAHTSEKVSFTAGLDALLLEPGDIIQINDELKSFVKNFGTVLYTSGTATYADPDHVDGAVKYGVGPRAIVVEPSQQSDNLEYIDGGTLSIRNPLGQTGIGQFYLAPNSDNDLYKEIHQSQVIDIELRRGGSGLTYDVSKDGVIFYLDLGAPQINGGNYPSQWFSEKDANILHGAHYSVDASGRFPRYYKVLSVEESEEKGFDVTAMIHHTGKYEFIEGGIGFDEDSDVFEPELTLSQVLLPDKPTSVTTGAFQQQQNGTLVLPIEITAAISNAGDKYVVILEEPNTNTIEGEVNKSVGLTTDFNLSGEQVIDQIGEYTIITYSYSNLNGVRSTGFVTTTFTTTPDDFSFDINNDAFIEYNKISLRTDFSQSYSFDDKSGAGFNSFKEEDPLINAVLEIEFRDAFGQVGNQILQSVSGQSIDLYNLDGDLLVEDFKTLSNETSVTIYNEEVTTGFGYTGDGRYVIKPGSIDFEVHKFNLPANNANHFVSFEQNFDETPVVFTSQVVDNVTGNYNKIGMKNIETGGFYVSGVSDSDSHHHYVATKTGVFKFNNDQNKIEVGITTKNNSTADRTVQFVEPFDTPPNVIIQLQEPETSKESYFCETVIKNVTTDGFDFNAFQEDGTNPDGTGRFAYIATESKTFNVLTSSQLPTDCINYGSTGEASFVFDSDSVLQFINKDETSVGSAARFGTANSAIFSQRSGVNANLQDKCLAVLKDTDRSKVFLHHFDEPNDTSGMYFGSADESSNFIDLELSGTYDFTSDFSFETWVKFSPDLTGKQYLFEYHTGDGANYTGISWFQSGDGRNYINMNGTDIAVTNISTNLNDSEIHNIRITIDRDGGSISYIDGAFNIQNFQPGYAENRVDLYTTGLLFKILSNSELEGGTLHQGGVYNYMCFYTGFLNGNYTNNPNSFRDTYSGDPNTVFLIGFDSTLTVPDYTSRDNNITTNGDLIFLDNVIDQTSFSSNLNIFQIHSTGSLL